MEACKTFLKQLSEMPETVVSIFSFDDVTFDLCVEAPASEAILKIDKLTMGGKGTNFRKAIERVIGLITEASEMRKNFINCLLFFSDGDAEFPDVELEKFLQVKNSGKHILLFSITCENDEDESMQKMAVLMNGDHYKTTNSNALRQIFQKILTLT